MNISFNTRGKKNLGVVLRSNEYHKNGKKATVDIDLNLVNKLVVEHDIDGVKYVDTVKIESDCVYVPFKKELFKNGVHKFELIAYMKNGDILPSQTCVHSVKFDEHVNTGVSKKDSYVLARTNEYTIDNIRVYPIVVDMESVDNIQTNIKFKQYDYGTSNVVLQVFDGDVPLKLNNVSIVASFLNAADNVVLDTVKYNNLSAILSNVDGIIKLVVPKDVMKYYGDVECEVILFDTEEKRSTSPRLSFSITESLVDHEDVNDMVEDDRYTVLSTLMKNTNDMYDKAGVLIRQNEDLHKRVNTAEIDRNTNEQTRISNENKRKTDHSSRLTEMNNTIQSVERRFESLSTSRQQDAEVITARNGEASLTARLERDLAKGKVIEEVVTGEYVTVNNTVPGNITNIEIYGNTIQDPHNLADIESAGVDIGNGTYEIDVISCGENLLDDNLMKVTFKNGTIYNGAVIPFRIDTDKFVFGIFAQKEKIITHNVALRFYDKDKKELGFYSADNSRILCAFSSISVDHTKIRYIQLFTNDKAPDITVTGVTIASKETIINSHELYQSTKNTISLPCKLEKVGAVADKLYYDWIETAWCIEKNIVSIILDGSRSEWVKSSPTGSTSLYMLDIMDTLLSNTKILAMSNKFKSVTADQQWVTDEENVSINAQNKLGIRILNSKCSDVTTFKQWLNINNILIHYITSTPQKIILPLSTQIELDSFLDKTNVWIESGRTSATIKATVPKSTQASLQSVQNELQQHDDRLTHIENLSECQNVKYESNTGVIVAKNSKQGVVKDFKVSGETLINFRGKEVSKQEWIYKPETNSYYIKDPKLNLVSVRFEYIPITPEKGYTVIMNITKNTLEHDVPAKITISSDTNVNGYVNISRGYTGLFMVYLPNMPAYSDDYIKSISVSNRGTVGEFEFSNLMVLEGNYIQNSPSYFEGMKSVGDDVDRIEVLSVNENRIDTSEILPFAGALPINVKGDVLTFNNSADTSKIVSSRFRVHVNKNENLILNRLDNSNEGIGYIFEREDKSIAYQITRTTRKLIEFTSPNEEVYYIRPYTGSGISINISTKLSVSTQGTYTPHKSDKKPMLYQDPTTQEYLPVPVLHKWDMADYLENKWYKRSGKVVLDGSENWTLLGDSTTNTIGFGAPKSVLVGIKNISVYPDNNKSFVDKFTYRGGTLWSIDNEGYALNADDVNKTLQIKILKSKLSTPDLAGFKKKLKEWYDAGEPCEVVYQLAEEEVYDLLPNSLQSFDGETMVMLNAGAINGNINFKLSPHIGNIVKDIQNEVDSLTDWKDKLDYSMTIKGSTDKGYDIIPATQNGVVKDINVYGKTLVNIVPLRNMAFLNSSIRERIITLDKGVEYTIIYQYESSSSSRGRLRFDFKTGSAYTYLGTIVSGAGQYIEKIVTPENFETCQLYCQSLDGSLDFKANNIIILKGDHTQSPPNGYLEGVRSVGENVNVMEVGSVKSDGNLFNVYDIPSNIQSSNYELTRTDDVIKMKGKRDAANEAVTANIKAKVFLESGKRYYASYKSDAPHGDKPNTDTVEMYWMLDGGLTHYHNVRGEAYVTCKQTGWYYPRFDLNKGDATHSFWDIQIKPDTSTMKYQNYIYDSKPMLYQDPTTSEWLPIPALHEWDLISSLENKWHKRSNKVVLNGSEDWNIDSGSTSMTKCVQFRTPHNGYRYVSSAATNYKVSIIPHGYERDWQGDFEKFFMNKPNYIVCVTKSRIGIVDSDNDTVKIQKFKTWLQSNNIPVAYETAQEEVYDTSPLTVDAYDGETMLMFNTGAINPKVNYSIHANITQLVSENKERIKNLEKDFYKYTVTQNRRQLSATYSADSITFKVDHQNPMSIDMDSDIYTLIQDNILVGKDNYDYDKMFGLVLDYASWSQITWEQFDILVALMDYQNTPQEEEII